MAYSATILFLLSSACFARRIQETDESLHLLDESLEDTQQAKKCEDSTKWGAGCDLDCPTDCPQGAGCDFLGNCLSPPNCKHEDGVAYDQESRTRVTVNTRGQCQACVDGFHGLFCEKECPSNCKKGQCTRGGRCYACEKGFFGPHCDGACPSACPKCVFMDNLVTDPNSGNFLPAGTCPDQCKTDSWGGQCDQKCPATCKKNAKSKAASCAKESGTCFECQEGWFGEKCESACSTFCEGGCDKTTGTCALGCKSGYKGDRCDVPCGEGCLGACDRKEGTCSTCKTGFWGESCELKATEGSLGDVDKETGKPKECRETTFPVLEGSSWTCAPCPGNCVDSMCNTKGFCTRGCAMGFFGNDCEKSCPGNCIGACDATATGLTDGRCTECRAGFAGKHCTHQCHKSCATCNQHSAATCVTCFDDEPAQLEASMLGSGLKCGCISGASRGEDGRCHCDEPPSNKKDIMMARFENSNAGKVCRHVCKTGTHEILGKEDFTCMSAQEHTAVVRAVPDGTAPSDLPQDDCKTGERKVGSRCVRLDFINYIITGFA